MKTTKFVPPNESIAALMRDGQKNGLNHYRQRIIDCGHDLADVPIRSYDFNRAFEYGIQWALGNLERLGEFRE